MLLEMLRDAAGMPATISSSLAAQDLSRAFRRLAFQQPRGRIAAYAGRRSDRARQRSTAGRHMTQRCWRRPASRCAGICAPTPRGRRSRARAAATAQAADRPRRRGDQRRDRLTQPTGTDRKRRSTAYEPLELEPPTPATYPEPPFSRRQRRHHPRRPGAGGAARARPALGISTPCPAAWSRPARP